MAHEWQEMRLADCMDAIIDYRGKTPKKTESGIPLITAKIIKNGRIEPVSEFIAEDDYDSWMRRGMPLPGDIVMTTEAPLGEIAQLDNRKIALAQRVITLRGKRGLLDNTFLKYLMISNYVQHQLDGRGTGTTVKGIKQSELREVLLKFPPFSVQKQIANILGSLDEKIETNRQTNQILEAMAQALFKSWFVDFDPVIDNALAAGHEIPPELQARAEARKSLQARAEQRQASLSGDRSEQESGDILPESIRQLFPNRFVLDAQMGWIPEGWEVKDIASFSVKISKGTTPRKQDIENATSSPIIPFIKVKDISENGVIGVQNLELIPEDIHHKQLRRSILNEHDVLFTIAGTIGRVSYVHSELENSNINQAVAFIRTESATISQFLYFLLKTEAIQNKISSKIVQAVQANVSLGELGAVRFIAPTEAVLASWYEINSACFAKTLSLRSSNASLSKIRDTLLPKLISGELRLPESTSVASQQETTAA